MTVMLENEHIRVCINEHGAELSEIILKKTGANYLWSGDAKYWGRHAPVLFKGHEKSGVPVLPCRE